jgi:hypothetical protein
MFKPEETIAFTLGSRFFRPLKILFIFSFPEPSTLAQMHHQAHQLDESHLRPIQANQQSKKLLYGSFSQPRKTCVASSHAQTSHLLANNFVKQTAVGCSQTEASSSAFTYFLMFCSKHSVCPKKSDANLVPSDQLLKILRRMLMGAN